MDSARLTSSEFWQSDACHVMVNDRDAAAVVQAEVLTHWCEGNDDLAGHLLFSTSGSTGVGKWVALSRPALLASAQAVNVHLGVREDDHWLLALPTFHVGGMGIVARTYLADCGLSYYDSAWDAGRRRPIIWVCFQSRGRHCLRVMCRWRRVVCALSQLWKTAGLPRAIELMLGVVS